MQGFWLKFTDDSKGYCEGTSAYDVVRIAEKLTGKRVIINSENKYQPKLQTLPYPANPIIWQFEHPIDGKCPPFCFRPDECAGRGSCPQSHSCTD